MDENKIKAPFIELDKAKEKFFNKSAAAVNHHHDNAYRQTMAIHQVIEEIYNEAYSSGYNQRVLETAANTVENA